MLEHSVLFNVFNIYLFNKNFIMLFRLHYYLSYIGFMFLFSVANCCLHPQCITDGKFGNFPDLALFFSFIINKHSFICCYITTVTIFGRKDEILFLHLWLNIYFRKVSKEKTCHRNSNFPYIILVLINRNKESLKKFLFIIKFHSSMFPTLSKPLNVKMFSL